MIRAAFYVLLLREEQAAVRTLTQDHFTREVALNQVSHDDSCPNLDAGGHRILQVARKFHSYINVCVARSRDVVTFVKSKWHSGLEGPSGPFRRWNRVLTYPKIRPRTIISPLCCAWAALPADRQSSRVQPRSLYITHMLSFPSGSTERRFPRHAIKPIIMLGYLSGS